MYPPFPPPQGEYATMAYEQGLSQMEWEDDEPADVRWYHWPLAVALFASLWLIAKITGK
jgi:hypothetical protein